MATMVFILKEALYKRTMLEILALKVIHLELITTMDFMQMVEL